YDKAYEESKQLCLYGLVGSLILSITLIATKGLYIGLYNVEADVSQVGSQLLVA
ncbi:MATE family efflux transporter, partial [Streptococcus gallolyticus subsp. gallolyticus]|nr:MATE family efflux transporter [Streptococcus gallolyticus subsp. gallolyticus]